MDLGLCSVLERLVAPPEPGNAAVDVRKELGGL